MFGPLTLLQRAVALSTHGWLSTLYRQVPALQVRLPEVCGWEPDCKLCHQVNICCPTSAGGRAQSTVEKNLSREESKAERRGEMTDTEDSIQKVPKIQLSPDSLSRGCWRCFPWRGLTSLLEEMGPPCTHSTCHASHPGTRTVPLPTPVLA